MKFDKYMFCIIMCVAAPVLSSDDEKEAIQKQLDDACQAAREARLIPLREQYARECVEKGREPGYCKRFYSTYGDATPTMPPMFLDLPECVRAFEYQKNR